METDRRSILFIAPNLLAGAGGVADYCARLRGALGSSGFECYGASWNERAEDAPPVSLNKTLMLDDAFGAKARVKAARLHDFIQASDPAWISLQFVNFGFAKRGLIGSIVRPLVDALRGRRVHLFLHELWVEEEQAGRLRDGLLGRLQKSGLLRLIKELRPRQIWTSIPLYQARLKNEGFKARVVPVFGTIPISADRADDTILQRVSGGEEPRERSRYFLVGLFGSVDETWPFPTVIPRLARYAAPRKLVVVLLGRTGPAERLRSFIRAHAEADLISFGEMNPAEIDRVMNSMDAAIATTPAEGILKSSSALAFLERGVPTIALHRGFGGLPAGDAGAVHPNLVLVNDELEKNLAAREQTRERCELFPLVVQQYAELFRTS